MTINHIDQLAEWWREAERGPISSGDTLIQHHPSDDTEYTVYVATEASTDSGNFVRILARAPKPKPAWHDAVVVTADVGRIDGARRVFVKDENGVWIDALTGHGYTAGHLRDVTPLIEAKVTDEMRARAIAAYEEDHGSFAARIDATLTAALGIEAE